MLLLSVTHLHITLPIEVISRCRVRTMIFNKYIIHTRKRDSNWAVKCEQCDQIIPSRHATAALYFIPVSSAIFIFNFYFFFTTSTEYHASPSFYYFHLPVYTYCTNCVKTWIMAINCSRIYGAFSVSHSHRLFSILPRLGFNIYRFQVNIFDITIPWSV